MKKISIIIIISALIGFLGGYFLGRYTYRAKPINVNVQFPDSLIQRETEYLDSLYLVEKRLEALSGGLSDSVRVLKDTAWIRVKEVKELPLDSGVLYLRKKLEKYEKN